MFGAKSFNFVIKWKVHKTFTVFSGQLPAQCITCTGTKMLIFRKQLLYYPQRQITCISHRTKTVVATILYASVLGTGCLLVHDHAIFICKIAAELILIAHFTNLILGTKGREGRYTLCLSYAFFQYLLWVICLRWLFVYFNPFTTRAAKSGQPEMRQFS